MKISGLQKLTLLDYPGHTACTVFLRGCNFRCPFCYNSPLVTENDGWYMTDKELSEYLAKRKGLIDGVAITGGEPTLYPELEELCRLIKSHGLDVKLDTNGTDPDKLITLVDNGLVDYVAMDLKNSPERYPETAGNKSINIESIFKTAEYLKTDPIPHEFRTTVVKELHSEESMRSLGRAFGGKDQYFIQNFKDNGSTIGKGMTSFTYGELCALLEVAREYFPNASLRGFEE